MERGPFGNVRIGTDGLNDGERKKTGQEPRQDILQGNTAHGTDIGRMYRLLDAFDALPFWEIVFLLFL
jgi:hypothetical protein